MLFNTTDAVENVSFVHALFMSDEFRRAIACLSSGMVMQRTEGKLLLDLKVPVFTLEERRRVATKFDNANAKVERMQQEATILSDELRSACYGSVRPLEDSSKPQDPAVDA